MRNFLIRLHVASINVSILKRLDVQLTRVLESMEVEFKSRVHACW